MAAKRNPTHNIGDELDMAGFMAANPLGSEAARQAAAEAAERVANTPIVVDETDQYDFEKPARSPRRGNGTGAPVRRANRYGDANEPSPKQVRFLTSLLERKMGWVGTPQEYIASLRQGWTKRYVITAIDALLAMDDAKQSEVRTAPAKIDTKPNRYPGKCTKCGGWVEAEAGVLVKTSDGRWGADHTECPAAPAAPKTEAPEGMHRTSDGTIFKVQVAHHGSGNKYAKRLVVHTDADGNAHGEFEYAPGAIKRLSEDTLMSLDEAKQFGHLYGFCCVCAAILTDEKSIEAGIGPVCARRF